MPKFPIDAPLERVLCALQALGFHIIRRGNHVSLARTNPDGTVDTMTIPGHRTIKGSTLRTALLQAGLNREAFLLAYENC